MCSNIIKDTNYLSTCPSVYLSVSLSLSLSLSTYIIMIYSSSTSQNSQQLMCLSPKKTRMPEKYMEYLETVFPTHLTPRFLRPGADGLFFLGSGITPIVTLHRPADESWIVCKHTWQLGNNAELSVSSS